MFLPLTGILMPEILTIGLRYVSDSIAAKSGKY